MELNTKWAGRQVVEMQSTLSTNLDAKNSLLPHGTLFIAEEQTQGRGRNGRVWQSRPGSGIYMSLLLRPDLPADCGHRLTMLAAASVCSGLRGLGVDAYIKWPNDIVANSRKLVGMLCETVLRGPMIDRCAMGIGINYAQQEMDFDPAFRSTATSLDMLMGSLPPKREVIQAVLSALEERYDNGLSGKLSAEYEELCATINRTVRVLETDNEWTGMAQGIASDGALLVKDEHGDIRKVYAGDVSVRGLLGYV